MPTTHAMLEADKNELRAKIERLRGALIDLVELHDIDVTDGTIRTAIGSERWRRVEGARAAIKSQ